MKFIRVPIFFQPGLNRISLCEEWDGTLSLETNDAYIASHGTIPLGIGKTDNLVFGTYYQEAVPWMYHGDKELLRRHLARIA